MIDAYPGAIPLSTVAAFYDKPCRIIGVLWVGSTVAGDAVMIKGRLDTTNNVMWAAQTDSGNTYLGAIWGPPGIHAPNGFRAERLDGGVMYVYISQ